MIFSLIKQMFIMLLSFSSSLARVAKISARAKCESKYSQSFNDLLPKICFRK